MSHIICLSSVDSFQYHVNNKAIDFISMQPKVLQLDGRCEIGLIDYELSTTSAPIEDTHIKIHCNLVNESYVNGKMQSILRPLYIKRNTRQYHEFRYPLFVQTNTNQFSFIHIHITNNKGKEPSFPIDSFKCTLLLRRINDEYFGRRMDETFR